MAIIGVSENWLAALACAAVLGASGTYIGVTMQSLIQTDLPDDMRGRVMSIWVVVGLGATAIGAFILGALVELVGLKQACLGISAIGLVAILALSRRTHKGAP
jgi:MFS family permease